MADEPIVRSEWQEKLHGFISENDTDKTEHLAAIGRIVTAFNGIEVMLNQILRGQIGGDAKKARLLVGAMRLKDMMDGLRRLVALAEWPTEQTQKLEELFRQINALKLVRDDVAHRVWAVRGREMSFSTAHVSRREDSAEFAIYTIDELNELARYAPALSMRALDLFPDTMFRAGQPPSPPMPERLRKKDSGRRPPQHPSSLAIIPPRG